MIRIKNNIMERDRIYIIRPPLGTLSNSIMRIKLFRIPFLLLSLPIPANNIIQKYIKKLNYQLILFRCSSCSPNVCYMLLNESWIRGKLLLPSTKLGKNRSQNIRIDINLTSNLSEMYLNQVKGTLHLFYFTVTYAMLPCNSAPVRNFILHLR